MASRTHAPLVRALTEARAQTDSLFAMVRPDSMYERPIPERHRLIFYLGHLEAFDWNQIGQGALGLAPSHAEFDKLFAFGIDPPVGQLPADKPSDWPSEAEVRTYNMRVRQSLDKVLDRAPEQMLYVAVEHRQMHAETFAYILHNLSSDRKTVQPTASLLSGPAPVHSMIAIPEGTATLGRNREDDPGNSAIGDSANEAFGDSPYEAFGDSPYGAFGWDNEFGVRAIPVPSFAISKYKVTNGQYLEFVRAGADAPPFWTNRGNQWFWRTMSGDVPLPLDWPVYTTHTQAQTYAQWIGKALPTEEQFHRAAYGTPSGEERPYPWGHEPPYQKHGNFNSSHWNPIPVTASPAGDSAFGVSQLVGNGWEWTATPFQPFPDFQPFSFYPGYSAPFFDGDHYVLKGASPRTAGRLLRRSFRNWFRAGYPYAYSGFRCVDK